MEPPIPPFMGSTSLIPSLAAQLVEAGTHVIKDKNLWKMIITYEGFRRVMPAKQDLLWDKNRPINAQKVQAIKTDYQRNGSSHLINATITIGTIQGFQPKILDGQHRFEAYSQLFNLDQDNLLLIDLVDYANEDERFHDFLRINTNTPLPEIYRDISDRSSFNRCLAERLRTQIMALFSQHFSAARDEPYNLNAIELKERLYASLLRHTVAYENAEAFPVDFITYLQCPILFPPQVEAYPLLALDLRYCQKVNKEGGLYQCEHRPKPGGNYCGLHKRVGCKTPDFDGIHVRQTLFQRASRFMLWFNYTWIDRIQNQIHIKKEFPF